MSALKCEHWHSERNGSISRILYKGSRESCTISVVYTTPSEQLARYEIYFSMHYSMILAAFTAFLSSTFVNGAPSALEKREAQPLTEVIARSVALSGTITAFLTARACDDPNSESFTWADAGCGCYTYHQNGQNLRMYSVFASLTGDADVTLYRDDQSCTPGKEAPGAGVYDCVITSDGRGFMSFRISSSGGGC